MARNNSLFFVLVAVVAQLYAAEIVIDKLGSYHFERRVTNEIVLVHTDSKSGVQTTRVLPPTVFPLTSIIQSGSVTNQDIIENLVTVAANDVIFNLNGFNLTQGLVISGKNVRVKNGLIDPTALLTAPFNSTSFYITNGINVVAGSANVIIDSVTVRNATSGILFNSVSGGGVYNCEMLYTSTGLQLNQSNNIIVKNSTATQCTLIGFSLVSSTTNSFTDCVALNTGANNTTIINNYVAGFFSKNGYGNVFERCIANATQALSTTDFNSAVAGFALVGTEAGSTIINCEASNAQTNSNGVTVPYGIFLQATLNNPLTLTGVSSTTPLLTPLNCEWSPDGNYIAVGDVSPTAPNLYIYQYNYRSNVVTLVASANDSLLQNPQYIKWSPDGRHIAVSDGTTNNLLVYNFIPISNDLLRVAYINVASLINNIYSVDWSPDGKYIAVADFGTTGGLNGIIFVYAFDSIANTLTVIAQTNSGATPLWASWSPDGQYIAVANATFNDLFIFKFSPTSSTLTFITRANASNLALPTTVSWSPNGQYIAIYASTSSVIAIYHFNPTYNTLVQLTAVTAKLTSQFAPLSWSSDSRYVTFPSLSGAVIVVYQFDPGTMTFTQVASDTPNSVGGKYAVWSPDGQYIASVSGNPVKLNLFQALTFPTSNVITNNILYCNTGASQPNGVGIFGSSIANLIIQNSVYANPPNPFMVPSNYQFVQNVFNQNFGDAPTTLQNISMGYQQVVTTPANVALLAQQLNFDVLTSMQSAFATVSLVLSSTTVTTSSCLPTQITAGTTITAAGIYCLGSDLATPLVINASNVQLNLNYLVAASGIQVGGGFDQVTIFNGSVSKSGGNAIDVSSGATNLTLSQVRAHNSIIGINLANVNTARIAYCDLFSNSTGINLTSCANVTLDSCIAQSNVNAGFSLISSSTNVLSDCESLATGDTITSARQNVFGFISNNGSGNIFERCIANSTQGLTVTAGDSVVAGFALRGSEQYSKIIGCESSNATTSPSGVTIPYGIWLESQFSGLVSVTSINPAGNTTIALSAKWSRDGVYLAVLPFSTTNLFIIYKFDYLKKGLVEVVRNTQSGTTNLLSPSSLLWSPDGNYLVTIEEATSSTNNGIFLYRFDKLGQAVQLVTSIDTGVAAPVLIDWSSDGKYLAVTIAPAATGLQAVLLIYQFDEVNQTLTQVATLSTSQVPSNATGAAVAWSPDGNYVALGLAVNTTTNDLYLYQFNRTTQTLVQVDVHSIDPGGSTTEIYSIAWSFDSQYVAVGSGSNNASFDVNVFQFNRTTQTLTFVAGLPVGSSGGFQPVLAITWSPDGKYLAFGGNISNSGDTFYVYQFNRGSGTLSQVAAINPNGGSADVIYDVEWSPDGQYLAVAGSIVGTPANAVIIYQALTFPNANMVMDNTVYCNSGALFPSGVGISGSTVANMIIQNNAYSNPINKNSQNPIVPSNYLFATNVFNPILQNTPSLTQNIGLGDAQVVPQPQNVSFLAKQVNAQVAQLGLCGPTAVLAATSITASGDYCLAQNVTGDIIITSSYVQFDLNKRCVFGHLAIYNTGESLITNGFIRPPDPTTTGTQALLIGPGCVHVTASNLFIDASLSVTTANGVQGQDGVSIAGNDTQLIGCTIKGGNATAATTAGAGARGGYGISLLAGATRTIIQDCVVLQTGNGGAANGAANVGGDAGHGIHVASGVNSTKIGNCLIMSTGSGGAGVSAAGGRGGDAVRVESGANNIEVRNCRMRNTGTGGSGSTLGVPGKAVFDLVTTPTTLSSIFTNFAFNIANPTKFDIQATGIAGGPNVGVQTPNPPTSGVINLFANVFSS